MSACAPRRTLGGRAAYYIYTFVLCANRFLLTRATNQRNHYQLIPKRTQAHEQ